MCKILGLNVSNSLICPTVHMINRHQKFCSTSSMNLEYILGCERIYPKIFIFSYFDRHSFGLILKITKRIIGTKFFQSLSTKHSIILNIILERIFEWPYL